MFFNFVVEFLLKMTVKFIDKVIKMKFAADDIYLYVIWKDTYSGDMPDINSEEGNISFDHVVNLWIVQWVPQWVKLTELDDQTEHFKEFYMTHVFPLLQCVYGGEQGSIILLDE